MPAVVAIIAVAQASSYSLKLKYKDKYIGIYRLLFIYFITIALGIVLLPLTGLDWKTAIVQANVLAHAQVFGHQVYKNTRGFLK
jgi:hypothetical protein